MQPTDPDLAVLPAIDVIVPVFNESGLIGDKLADVAQLDYPRDRLVVWVADGGSTDGTAEAAVASSARAAGLDVRLVRANARGKPAQLSEAFEAVTSDWVMVTDCDARLDPSTLRAMLIAARADAHIGLVGAAVEPRCSHPLDRAHWKAVNWLRALEARAGCAGLVVGPAYLARRDLLGPFPGGTIMDDVHLCCRAALLGARIAMVPSRVVELRAPVGVAEFARHKFRKALGYMHELLYFLPLIRSMRGPARAAYLWRVSLVIGIPIVTLWAAAFVAAAGSAGALLIGAGALAGALVLSSTAHSPVSMAAAVLSLPFAWSTVLTSAFLVYPFMRQTARYPKVTLSRRGTP